MYNDILSEKWRKISISIKMDLLVFRLSLLGHNMDTILLYFSLHLLFIIKLSVHCIQKNSNYIKYFKSKSKYSHNWK